MKKVRVVVSLGLSILLFCVSVVPVFASETSFEMAYNNLLAEKPYTQNYIDCTQKLFDEKNKSDSADALLIKKVETLLNSATARIDFMMEDTISRLGDKRDVTVTNFRYVRETLDEISATYKLPMMERHSPQNDAIFNEFRRFTSEFLDNEKIIIELQNTIDTLAETEKLDSTDLDTLFRVVEDSTDYYNFISAKHYEKAMKLAKENYINDSNLDMTAISENQRNLSQLDGSASLKKEVIDKKIPTALEKRILTGYKVVDSFKLTYEGKGGVIAPTKFTLNSTVKGAYLLHGECLQLNDIDTNENTITFDTKWLGDYYVVEPFSFFEYTTNFNSKMEWRFQNASMAKLIYNAKAISASSVEFTPNDIKNIPRSVIKTIVDMKKSIIIKGENGEMDVSLLPKAFEALTVKEEILPVKMLYSYAKSTELKPEFSSDDVMTTSGEQTKQTFPPDLFKDDPNDASAPSLTRILAIAGIIVALAGIAFLIKREAEGRL